MTDKEVKVQKYLLKNPLATVTQIHKATKVSKSYAHKIGVRYPHQEKLSSER